MDLQISWQQDIAYLGLQTLHVQKYHEPILTAIRVTRDLPGEQLEDLKHLSDSQGLGGNNHCNPRHTQDCVRNVMSHTSNTRRANRTHLSRGRCYAAVRKRFAQSSFRPNP
jgi:hypothetical protein